jgi:uncharacterized protein
MTGNGSEVVRLRIYLDEDETAGDKPLYHAVVREVRILDLAGTLVLVGREGFGRSTRLHTSDVLFSQDSPVVMEIVDHRYKIQPLIGKLNNYPQIGLITCKPVELLGHRDLTTGAEHGW